jgi:O-antigen ligase
VLHLRHWLAAANLHPNLRYQLLLLGLIFIVPLAASLVPFAQAGADDAESFALSLAKDKGGEASERTLDLRLRLWGEAAELGVRSGGLGLGPGPHLSPPPHLRPESREQPFEAHNTPLDIFLQSGFIGLATLGGFVLSTALLLYRAKLDFLLTLIVAITIFSSAHLNIRHPIVWFALALCVSMGCANARLAPAKNAET